MKSGILAGESIYDAILKNENNAKLYNKLFQESWLYQELYKERNIHSYFSTFGKFVFMLLTGFEKIFFRGKTFWDLKDYKYDHERTLPMSECKKIEYPKHDNKITFDLLTNLQKSGTIHENDQPSHLKLTVIY
jgi:electron-transferring-flavoprotein dehydrogenase